MADDEVEQDLEPLPENYIDVMLTRTSSKQYVAIENDTAVLKSVGSDAGSDSDYLGAWYSVFLDLVKDDYTVNQATSAIMHDLAWRYYNYPDKRDKIPLTVKPSFNNQAYKLQDCTSYGDWCIKNRFVNNAYGSLASQYCTLLELNHQGKYWSSISPGADILYKEWYEYYEGASSSGGALTGSLLFNAYRWNSNNDNINMAGTRYYVNREPFTPDNYTVYYNSYIANKLSELEGYTLLGQINGSYLYFIMVYATDYNINYRDVSWSGGTNHVPVQITSGHSIYVYRYNQPANGWPLGSYTVPDGNPTYAETLSQVNMTNIFYFSFGAGSGSGGGSNDPVISPGVPENPTPSAPSVTNINAPTYNTNNYTTINQTDVDLQPIIDALAIHDENMQDAWDSYSLLFNDWLDVMKQTLEGWRDAQLGYMETLYKDFVYYLDQVNFVLWQILEQLQMDTYVPVPDVETININYDNSVDRLSTKFPFSIPWDIKLVLVLLEQPRQAPEFDLPVLMSDYTVHVDLSPFEPMAEVSRFFSMLLFTAGLMMNTRKMVGF